MTTNYKLDAKRSRQENIYIPQGYDGCQTPPYALEPLYPYLDRGRIWEPARGQGFMAAALEGAGYEVISSDIQTGQNFFYFEPRVIWDILLSNPPYSIKYQWVERCYALDKPFALLIPLDALGTQSLQTPMKKYGAEILLLNQRVDFKMPDKGWYFDGKFTQAQFPVFWLCWNLLPEPIVYGDIKEAKKSWQQLYLANPSYWTSDGSETLTATYQQKSLF